MKRSLALFGIAGVLPLVIVGVGVGAWALSNQREAIEQRADDHAQFVATLVGRELAANMRSAQMITQSPGLDGRLDAERLDVLGRRLVSDEPSWRAISVADTKGLRLLDMPRAIGGVANGQVVDMDSLTRAVLTRKPVVGRVMRGPQGRYAFAVRAPVVRDDEVPYVVSTVVDPAALRPLLLPSSLPGDWRVEVVDGFGAIVAGSAEGGPVTGGAAGPEARAALTRPSPGFYRIGELSRSEEVATWRRIPDSDWTVHVAMPAAAYNAPLLQATRVLVAGAVVSLVLTALLALLLVRELRLHRQREGALVEAQRLEALGQMTGGVAHDFNNLLTPIMGGLDLLRRRLEGDARALRLVDSALISADRAKTLVSRLLTFARRQALETRDVDVGGLINGLADLLERSVGPNVRLVIEAPGNLPSARVDPAQLELAILNLAVNARDAMPAGGALTIAASSQAIGGDRNFQLPAGRYVRIRVEDTGLGMDPATLRRAVEPFYTTKLQGKGTGLGLSMVHGLAAQSGGMLRLESESGRGTRADIWLPAGEQITASGGEAETLLDSRIGRLLLVDDDDLVRQSTAALLRDHGHAVIEARSAFEALQAIKGGERFDVLITDYAMPGKNGAELIAEAREVRPGLAVLLITGFASSRETLPGDVIRLGKPYRRVELLNRIARLMPLEEAAAQA